MRINFLWVIIFMLLISSAASAETQTLEQAWVEAYQFNPSLQAARADLRSVDEQVSQALSHWRPNIDATSQIGRTYQYTQHAPPFTVADYASTTGGYGLQASQPIFRGFRTISETEGAEKQVLAGRAKLTEMEQKLLLDTATAYLDILRDQDIMELERDNEKVLRDKLKETQTRFSAGELAQTDLRQSESRLARAQVAYLQAQNSLTQGRTAYKRLVGREPDRLVPPEFGAEPANAEESIIHEAEMKNPNVVFAFYSVDQAKAQVDLNAGSLLPELNLVGNTASNWGQYSTAPGRAETSQFLLQLTMPLYRSGSDYSKAREAEQTVTQRQMELDDTRNRAREFGRNAWKAYEISEAALETDKKEVEAAKLALEGVKEESKVGVRTTLDVLNAEQELLDARIDQARSKHDRDLSLLQIKDAMGQLTVAALKLPVTPYDPARHYDDVHDQWLGFSKDEQQYTHWQPPALPTPSTGVTTPPSANNVAAPQNEAQQSSRNGSENGNYVHPGLSPPIRR